MYVVFVAVVLFLRSLWLHLLPCGFDRVLCFAADSLRSLGRPSRNVAPWSEIDTPAFVTN